MESGCLEAAVILEQALGQSIAPGEKPGICGTDGVVDGVPAAVAAPENGLGTNAIEMLGPVAQHRPAEVDASAAGPLRNDLSKRPVAEDAQVAYDELDRRV